MSIGLHVWLSQEIDLKSVIPFDGWIEYPDGHLEHVTKNFIALAFSPSRVFPEDVPDKVSELVPGIAWITELGLEGTTPAGEKALTKIALAIARAGHGVIEDPQQGTARTPSGVKRYVKPPRDDRVDVLALAWWAPGGPLLHRLGVEALITTIETHLPEALPHRWGLNEPPNHSWSDEGPAGLIEFLDGNRDDLVITIPRRPGLGVDFCGLSQWGEHIGSSRFEVPYLKIELEAQLLDQPGWGRQLSAAFTAISQVVEPFYGEARILRGVSRSTGHFDPQSPQHPVRRNRWCGIPKSAPIAAVVGPPYLELWPDFAASESEGLVFRNVDQWEQNQAQLEWNVHQGLTQEFDVHWRPEAADGRHPHGSFILEDQPGRSTRWPFPSTQAF